MRTGTSRCRRHGPAARPDYRRGCSRRRRYSPGRIVVRDSLMRGTYPRRVAGDDNPDELPKVTPAFLRRVEELCPRRRRVRVPEPARESPCARSLARRQPADRTRTRSRTSSSDCRRRRRSRPCRISFPSSGRSTRPPPGGTCSCSAIEPAQRRPRGARRLGDQGPRARPSTRRPRRSPPRGRRRSGRAPVAPRRRTRARRRVDPLASADARFALSGTGVAVGTVGPARPRRPPLRGLGRARRRRRHRPVRRAPVDPPACRRTARADRATAPPARPRVRPLPLCRRMQTRMADELRPEILTISPSAVDTWHRCRREFRSGQLLGIPGSDEGPSPDQGLLVHDLLRHIHRNGSCQDTAHVEDVLAAHGLSTSDAIRGYVSRHARRCPAEADDTRHELERGAVPPAPGADVHGDGSDRRHLDPRRDARRPRLQDGPVRERARG